MTASRGSAGSQWLWALALYLVVALPTTLPGLGTTGLIKMEGIVADVAATMLTSGDYVVPRLYGEIYTYKPPLVYWLTAASIHWGGKTHWALRLPSALALVVMGLMVLLLVGRLTRPHVGLLASVAAVTSMVIFSKSKLAEFDAVLTCAVGIAVAAACYNLAHSRRRGSLAIWLVCYLALAAAFLAKGPPALMAFAPGLVAAAIATGRGRELLGWRHLAGGVVFTGLVGVYLWQLWSAAGAAAFAQPLAEAHERGLDWTWATFARTLLKPLMIMVGFLPWSLAWPWSWPAPRGGTEIESPTSDRLSRASLAFLATSALVFMAVPTFEPRYFLPLSVAGAIVAAQALERGAAHSRRACRLAVGLTTLCALALVAAAAQPAASRIASAALGVAALLAVWLLLPRWPRQRVVATLLVAALCGWAAETLILRPDRARARDVEPVAAELRPLIADGETLWAYGTPDEVGKHCNVFFYLDRPVRVFLDADRGPTPDSPVLLEPAARQALWRQAPGFAARLEWIHTAGYRGRELFLYRLAP